MIRFEITGLENNNNPLYVTVSFNNSTLVFPTGVYTRRIFNTERENSNKAVFGLLEEYINDTYSDDDQANIFNLYRLVYDAYQNPIMSEVKRDELFNEVIRDLGEYVKWKEILEWMYTNNYLHKPVKIHEVFTENMAMYAEKETTYLKEDYFHLKTWSIALRALIPIISSYTEIYKNDYNDNVNQINAFKLLSKTAFITCEPYYKLQEYVDYYVVVKNKQTSKRHTSENSGINTLPQMELNFLIDYGIPGFMQSEAIIVNIVIRSLMVTNISTDEESIYDDKNIITKLYAAVNSKVGNAYKTNENEIKIKLPIAQSDDDEKSRSKLDLYKTKYELSPGEIEVINLSLMQWDNILKQMLPDYIHPDLPEGYLILLNNLITSNNSLTPMQVKLMSWVLSPVINPKALFVNVDKLVLAHTQVLVHHILNMYGFPYLALFTTSYVDTSLKDSFSLTTIDHNEKIPQDIIDEFISIYPYTTTFSNKKNIKPENLALTGVSDWVTEVRTEKWIANGMSNILDQCNLKQGEVINIQSDIKLLVMKMLIKVNLIKELNIE